MKKYVEHNLSHVSLFSDPGNPYYIFSPSYTDASSGIRALHYLCHALNLMGRDAYMCGSSAGNTKIKTPFLTMDLAADHKSRGLVPIAVYPEILSGNPLGAQVVVRYCLNKIGFILGNDIQAGSDDLYFYYDTSFVKSGDPCNGILSVPVTDTSLFSLPESPEKRSGSYLCLNRYLESDVDFSILPGDVSVLSRQNSLSLNDLAELFKKIEVLYSYEYSHTCNLAVLCGCPVIYMPGGLGYENLELNELSRKKIGWEFYENKSNLEINEEGIDEVRRFFIDAEDFFWTQLDEFIKITQKKSETISEIPATSNLLWGVPEWLSDRTPYATRILAIQSMLQANPDVGTLGIAVIVPDGTDLDALADTLDSLTAQHRSVDGIWLIGPQIPPGVVGGMVEPVIGNEPWPMLLSRGIEQGGMPDFIWILHAGDQLLPHATLTLGEYRLRNPNPMVWYADEAVLKDGVAANPMLKPDFNVDLLRSYPYIGRDLVISTAAILAAGGLDERVADLAPVDLLWRLVEQVGPPVVGHIPEVLQFGSRSLMDWVRDSDTMLWFPAVTQAHFVRMGLEAQVEPGPSLGLQRIVYPLAVQPLVSIIIPTRDQLPVLQACVEGLMEHTAYPHYELLIVDNGSVDPKTVAFLAGLDTMETDQIRVLRWPQSFDFAAMNNFAVTQARGDVLLFLNDDIQFASRTRSDWLERLLRHTLRPEIGMVGSRLDLSNGGVDQCGLVLGMDNSVGAAFRGLAEDRQGYMNRLIVQQNVSALSASCLMMRRQVFDELGGFDAGSFPIYYADVDLCMKATQAGYLLVLEPDTGLLHMGGATRLLTEKSTLNLVKDDAQNDCLYQRWLPQLARDPNYHPAFGKHSPGFDLSPEASRIQEPLPGRPLPVVLAAHADWYGCGHYRILHPFRAMSSELRLDGGLKHGDFHFTDVARIQPDVIVLQGAWLNEGILTQIRRYREITGAKVVLEFDDYLPNLPTRSIHRKELSQGAIKHMRRAIEQVDWLVVSTPTLAHEYARFHSEIRVALNGLPLDPWSGLQGQRRTKQKMRIGWAGGSSHTGDLAEIRSVVKDLQDEVEWVFMGMRPDDVPCEFHPGVAIDQYPAQLAALNLDLAVVPLELNQFNRCKSNLRLLELGACGVPVICTDIEPYQGDLPVTRVRNRHQDWVQAIREHLADPETLGQKGDALRDAVHRNWMLEGDFLDQWARAWGVASGAA